MEIVIPKIEADKLSEAAEKAAIKGALHEIEEYYTKWDSPYRKAIKEELLKKGFDGKIDLPEVMGLINGAISKEVDAIVNKAIATSYIPDLRKALVAVDKDIRFSDILKKFIEEMRVENIDDCSCEMELSEHNWYSVVLTHEDSRYELTLHEDHRLKKEGRKGYVLLSVPNNYNTYANHKRTMKIHIDDNVKVELPYTENILRDGFFRFCIGMMLCDSVVTVDTTDFEEDMFPEDECHC